LTGRPPFRGDTVLDTLEQVKEREPESPSRSNPRVDRDLETICLKCLQKEPARRYGSAQELAGDLEHWLAGEPIRARPLSRAARAWRWCRRHKAMASGGALVLVAVLLAGGSLWWLSEQQAKAERAVAGYLQQAALLQEQGRWEEAAQVLARAEERLAGGGPAGVLEQVRRLRDDADWVAELEEARLCAAEASPGQHGFNYAGADRAYQEAFARRGLNLGELDPGAAAARIRASAIRPRLVQALDYWAFTKEKLRAGSGEGLRVVAAGADYDPWRQRLRRLMTRKDPAALEQLAQEDGAFSRPPGTPCC
jgi:serine/threonine-protein kinase